MATASRKASIGPGNATVAGTKRTASTPLKLQRMTGAAAPGDVGRNVLSSQLTSLRGLPHGNSNSLMGGYLLNEFRNPEMNLSAQLALQQTAAPSLVGGASQVLPQIRQPMLYGAETELLMQRLMYQKLVGASPASARTIAMPHLRSDGSQLSPMAAASLAAQMTPSALDIAAAQLQTVRGANAKRPRTSY